MAVGGYDAGLKKPVTTAQSVLKLMKIMYKNKYM